MSETPYDQGTIVNPDETGTVLDPDVAVQDVAYIEPTAAGLPVNEAPVVNEAELITYPTENL